MMNPPKAISVLKKIDPELVAKMRELDVLFVQDLVARAFALGSDFTLLAEALGLPLQQCKELIQQARESLDPEELAELEQDVPLDPIQFGAREPEDD